MVPVMLVDSLCEFLQHELGQFMLTGADGTLQAPRVLAGCLQKGRSLGGQHVPFVMVGAVGGRDTNAKSLVQVKIWISAHSRDQNDFWRGPVNIAEHIRQLLLKKRVIAKKFRIEYPLKWHMSEDCVYPEFMAVMTTNWTVARPMEEVGYGQDQGYRVSWSGAGDLLRP